MVSNNLRQDHFSGDILWVLENEGEGHSEVKGQAKVYVQLEWLK